MTALDCFLPRLRSKRSCRGVNHHLQAKIPLQGNLQDAAAMGRQRKRWGKSPEAGEGITKTAGTQQEGCLLTPDLHGVASAPQGAALPARSLAEGCGQQRLSLRQVQALVLTLQGESSSAHEPEGSFLPPPATPVALWARGSFP